MERNAEDFAAKYQEIYQDMFRFALYTLKNRQEAEDVVSETVLDAWKGIEGLKNESAFSAWMFRILVNKCRKRLKSYLNRAVELPSDLAWRERDTSEDMDVRAAFYKLNNEERLVLSMNLFGGYTGKEIAAMLEMNENTVRSLKSRALKKMEQMLTAGEE
jgi:RNA polymerase sigma factor (sigma-70 family)